MEMNTIPFWKRRRTWVIFSILIFPFLSVFILTRSFVLSPLIAASLRSEFGAEVVIQGTSWHWGDGIQIKEIILKAEGVDGLAADVITLQNVMLHTDSFLPFSPEIDGIDIDSIRIRLAESDQHPGEFNFSHLIESDNFSLPKLTDSSSVHSGAVLAPMVTLKKLTVETGIMQGGDWTLDNSKIFNVRGAVQDEASTTLQLIDTNKSLAITLTINSSPFSVSAAIDDVQLDKSIFSLLPRTARTWCEETQLHGGISALDINWQSEQGIQIEASIENLQFQLPEEHGVPWATYRDGGVKRIHGDASLDVKNGKIIYDGQNVILTGINGLLLPPQQESSEPLQFSAEMKIYNFQSVGSQQGAKWMQSMLSDAPFKATFTINDFSPAEGNPGEVRVPMAAAQMLKVFQLEHWSMNAEVSVGRTELKGEIDVQGDMTIHAKEGKYVDFPYQLKNIRSDITFHKNEIQIVELKADGSEDAKVLIKGIVHVTQDDLAVELNLYAANAPIDEALHDAVSEQLATVMDKLIDYDAYEKITNSLAEPLKSSFELGGEIDLDLLIVHDSSRNEGVITTGSIVIDNIGILHRDFPYPMVLGSGYVILDEEGLHVPEDSVIRLEAYGGGRGFLDGSILFLEDGPAPAIAIKLDGEKVTSALVAAVFESAGEANELAAGILGGLGLTSKLRMKGSVIGRNDGSIDSLFTINLMNGRSKPNEKLAEAMGANGVFWPDDFEFTELNAEIVIENGVVKMEGVTCKCTDGGYLEASLEVDKGDFELQMRGEGLPISPRFADVLPQSDSDTLSRSWRWLAPTGKMDAVIWISQKNDHSDLYMTIEPRELYVSSNERTTKLLLKHGSIVVEDSNVFFNDLDFQLSERGESQGRLEINGEFSGELEAYWDKVSIDSPLTRAITGIAGGEPAVDYFDSMQPSGTASARAMLTTQGDDILYNIEIVPADLSATFHKRRAVAIFDSVKIPSANTIRFNNAGMHFDNLVGTLGEGVFSLDGEILSDETVEGAFDLTWSGPTGDDSLFAVLPSVVGDILVAIKIADGKSILPNGEVIFKGEDWKDLSVEFKGDIALEEVSLNVGIPLRKINGITRLVGAYNEEKLATLDMSIAVEEMNTLGRTVTDVAGSLEFEPEQNKFVFKEMRGESSTGGVTVGGWISLDDSKEYEIEVLIAGVELATGNGDGIVASLEGELSGLFSIAGSRGESSSRRGVGWIRVENGHLEIDPFSLTTMRVLQLALPSASTISGAEIDLYIVGDQIILDEITLRSSERDITDFLLEGEGTINFDTFEIQARLHPRAGLPIIREIAGLLNDQIYSIDVTGKLLNPEVSVVPLPFLSPQEN